MHSLSKYKVLRGDFYPRSPISRLVFKQSPLPEAGETSPQTGAETYSFPTRVFVLPEQFDSASWDDRYKTGSSPPSRQGLKMSRSPCLEPLCLQYPRSSGSDKRRPNRRPSRASSKPSHPLRDTRRGPGRCLRSSQPWQSPCWPATGYRGGAAKTVHLCGTA